MAAPSAFKKKAADAQAANRGDESILSAQN
jgi:hypothetical protein